MISIIKLFYLALIIIHSAVSTASDNQITISIQTELGPVKAELYPDKAPITVSHFLNNIEAGIYNNSQFFRTVHSQQPLASRETGFSVIEVRLSTNVPKPQSIAHENTQLTGIKNKSGVLAMSRDAPGSAAADFFINITDNPTLDYTRQGGKELHGFAAFGRVTKGMELIQKIHTRPSGSGEIKAEDKKLLGLLEKDDPEMALWYRGQLLDETVKIYQITIDPQATGKD